MDVPILFFLNSNEFQALMQELESQRVIMTTFMEEMKQQSQSNLENLRERGQPRQEVASKPERKFSNEFGEGEGGGGGGGGGGGSILITYVELVNFTAYLCRQRLDTFLPIEKREVLWRT